MTFLAPAFGWAFLSLGVILFLYLLKRRYEDRPVPSTFLWRRAARDLTASRPFQKLRRNILLPLHLLMAAVLALALMRPALPGGMAGETVMIFDVSASMQAAEGGVSRLELAKETAGRILEGMGPDDALTILAAGNETRQLLSRSTDREAARRALRALTPTAAAGDLSAAVSLAEAMQREAEGLRILVFSDDFRTDNPHMTVYNAEKGLNNRAILSFTVENGAGYARAANYGGECDLTLVCYAGETVCDAKTAHIPAGETAGVSFAVPDCAYARVEIREADAIADDNSLYFVSKAGRNFTVALCGDTSVFLENAVKLREDVTVVRVGDEERAAAGADLYIYGPAPLIFSKDPEQTEITAGEPLTPSGNLTFGERDGMTTGLTLDSVAVRAYRPLTGGRTLLTLDGNAVLAATGRTVALGFSVNDSNLPMKYDFPILVQNILSSLLPETAADVGEGVCGESVLIPLTGDEESAFVTLPDGKNVTPAASTGWDESHPFTDTALPGLYTLTTRQDGQDTRRYFALRLPAAESDVRAVAESRIGDGADTALSGGRELTGYLAGLFLLLLLVEWGVSRRVL